MNVETIDSIDLEKTLNLKNTAVGYTTFKVNEYSLTNSYIYSYPYCYSNNNCTTLKDIITVDSLGTIEKTTLLILNVDFHLDTTTIYANYSKSNTKFFDHFLSVESIKDDASKIFPVINRTPDQLNNILVLELQEEVKNADHLNLLVTIRNKRYKIVLK